MTKITNDNEKKEEQNGVLTMLLTFYDELVLIEEDCAFLCEAISCFLGRSEELESNVVNGFSRQADGLVFRMVGLKANFREILGLVRRSRDGD